MVFATAVKVAFVTLVTAVVIVPVLNLQILAFLNLIHQRMKMGTDLFAILSNISSHFNFLL